MAIDFNCPHCGLRTLVDDHYAGQTGPCATCGKPVTVPYAVSSAQPGMGGGVVVATNPLTVNKSSTGLMMILVIGGILGAVAVITLLVVLLVPAVGAARTATQNSGCQANMQQIGMALNAYAAEHGSYPPAYFADDTGRPMHSWRVMILPQLGEQAIYDQYNFDEPWDSPSNMQLMYMMPNAYGCPADEDTMMTFETSYVVLTGKNTMFPGAQSVRPSQLADGSYDTIMLVEAHNTTIMWHEPKDISADTMQFQINSSTGQEINSEHVGGAHVLTADGVSHFLDDNVGPEQLHALTTINGSEIIRWEDIEGL